jgi:hypothetical protein
VMRGESRRPRKRKAARGMETATGLLLEAAQAEGLVGGLEDGGRAWARGGPVELALVFSTLGPSVLEPDLTVRRSPFLRICMTT